jgi:hypothetical protein
MRVACIGLIPGLIVSGWATAALAADAAPVDHGGLAGVWTRARMGGPPGGAPPGPSEVDRFLGFRTEGSPGQTAVIIVPGVPPLKQPYLQQWKAHEIARHAADLRGDPVYDEHSQCLPDGMPSMMMAMFPMEVLQGPGEIAIVEEAYRQVRHIYLDQKQIAVADAEPEFWGHSVGSWDGDTLRVNTVGIKGSVTLEDVPHSDQMRIDERIRLLTPDRFEDAITVSDPPYLTHPWSFTWTYQRDPGYRILEYVCEDNREDSANGHQHLQLLDK